MITTTITLADKDENVRRLFAAEQQGLLNDRASYQVRHEQGKTSIEVSARDATALRAVLNSVCKTLIIHEKAGKAMHHGPKGSAATTRTN